MRVSFAISFWVDEELRETEGLQAHVLVKHVAICCSEVDCPFENHVNFVGKAVVVIDGLATLILVLLQIFEERPLTVVIFHFRKYFKFPQKLPVLVVHDFLSEGSWHLIHQVDRLVIDVYIAVIVYQEGFQFFEKTHVEICLFLEFRESLQHIYHVVFILSLF